MGMSLKSNVYLALVRTYALTMITSGQKREETCKNSDGLLQSYKPESELSGCCRVPQHSNMCQRRAWFGGAGLRD